MSRPVPVKSLRPARPYLGSATFQAEPEPVQVVERLALSRCLIRFASGSSLIVPDDMVQQ